VEKWRRTASLPTKRRRLDICRSQPIRIAGQSFKATAQFPIRASCGALRSPSSSSHEPDRTQRYANTGENCRKRAQDFKEEIQCPTSRTEQVMEDSVW
jgi:hypothetical protein